MAFGFLHSEHAADFTPGLDWIGVAERLTLARLRGKLFLLDFWTAG